MSKPRILISIILFIVTLIIGSYSIFSNRQLEQMGGMAEEYYILGEYFYFEGKFCPDDKGPFVLRPPGYSFFIASVLKIWGGLPKKETILRLRIQGKFKQEQKKAYNTIYISQCLLLSISTIILFLWMANYLRLGYAFVLALLFGCNPYMLILTGLLHYEILHIFIIIISCYMLDRSINGSKTHWAKIIFAGILWGLATLVRPVTLILPAFVLLILLFKFRLSWRPVLKRFIVFLLGMILVISPYTIRNYSITGKIIPVNAQGWTAFWGSTVIKLKRAPNHYKWWGVWYKYGLPVFYEVTGNLEYDFANYAANKIKMEAELKKRAFENLYNQPGVYFYNLFQNFLTINLDINSVLIKLFEVIQEKDKKIYKRWLEIGNPQYFYSSTHANTFSFFINIFAMFSFLGICFAIWQRDKFLLVPGLVYLCICTAHSLTYMDLMYYYFKLPFLFIFSGYFLNAIDQNQMKIPFMSWKVSAGICVFLIIFGMELTIAVIFN